MNFDLDFGQAVTIGSIMCSAAAIIWKLGRKDIQFDNALMMLKAHDDRLDHVDGQFVALREIIGDLSRLQAVQVRDQGNTEKRFEDYSDKFKDILSRLRHIEQDRARSLTDS